nr:MAG TPA: hypothetical protein [Caudoviricetes sp.]
MAQTYGLAWRLSPAGLCMVYRTRSARCFTPSIAATIRPHRVI